MLIVQKNQNNKLVVTVTEKTTSSNPFYIMKLFSNDNFSDKIVRFTGDTSVNTARWNEFYLDEVTLVNEDLYNAKANLNAGTYDFIIYATYATGLTTNGGTPVQSGMLKVKDVVAEDVVFSGKNTIVTFK